MAATSAAFSLYLWVMLRGPAGLFNDFYDYWAAARLLNQGGDPYDGAALSAVQHAAGLQVQAGGGYSYPLLLADLLRPLALMEPTHAAFLFTCASVGALGVATWLLVEGMEVGSWAAAMAAGLVAGLLEPVTGSLYFGQVNLLVLPLLVLAWRCRAPAPMVALAGAVKVYPLTALLALLTMREGAIARVLFSLSLLGLLVAVPAALHPNHGFLPHSASLLAADPYWSNQSTTGFVSRLAQSSDSTSPPLPGLPVMPVTIVIDLLLLGLVALVLQRAAGPHWAPAFALTLWLGIVVAPHNSLWNYAPMLVCLASGWMLARGRPHLRAALVLAVALIELQAGANVLRDWIYGRNPALTLVASSGLYGGLIVGAVLAREMLRPGSNPRLLHEQGNHELAIDPGDRALPA